MKFKHEQVINKDDNIQKGEVLKSERRSNFHFQNLIIEIPRFWSGCLDIQSLKDIVKI